MRAQKIKCNSSQHSVTDTLTLLTLPTEYADQGLCNGRASIRPIIWQLLQCAARLLLSTLRGHTDRQWQMPVPNSNGATAWGSAANTGNVMLTAELPRLNTDLLV